MMNINWLVVLGTGIIPLIIGGLWYSPMLFANAWMKAADMTEEKMKGANMALIFGLTLLFGVMISLVIMNLVIHQMHYYSILANNQEMADPNSAISQATKAFMDVNGANFRTFKHGALHGSLTGLFLALPMTSIMSLFERKGLNYILIHSGYWILTFTLMGGIICAFA